MEGGEGEDEVEVEASGEAGVVEASTEEGGGEEAEVLAGEEEEEGSEGGEEGEGVRTPDTTSHCFSQHFFIFSRTNTFS